PLHEPEEVDEPHQEEEQDEKQKDVEMHEVPEPEEEAQKKDLLTWLGYCFLSLNYIAVAVADTAVVVVYAIAVIAVAMTLNTPLLRCDAVAEATASAILKAQLPIRTAI
ncbi:hypothetical protein A2U01_0036911, partial [Trifolium medium]|nr:hypothetical protein [Trifolium medium]